MIELDDLLTQRNKINLRFHTKTLIGRSEALLGLLYFIMRVPNKLLANKAAAFVFYTIQIIFPFLLNY